MATKQQKRDKRKALKRQERQLRRQERGYGDFFGPSLAPFGERMSQVLSEFVEPYLGTHHFEDLLTIGVTAWNATVDPGHESQLALHDLIDATPRDEREEVKFLIADMQQRKYELFADDMRLMLDFDVRYTPTGKAIVSVVSALPV
jgi:hypothetical protein